MNELAEEIEKEAIKWVKNAFPNDEFKQSGISRALVEFAEFGYNKANEWHEIESKVTSKREISMQYMPKHKEKVLLKYRFFCDDEIHISDGYYDAYNSEFHIAYNPEFRIICVIAWREFPKKENE